MESKNVNYLVMAFVFLIVGVALIGTVASEVNSKAAKTLVYDEADDMSACMVDLGGSIGFSVNESASACNLTVTNAPSGWKSDDCPLTGVALGNATLDWTSGTDYQVVTTTGVIALKNTTATQNGYANSTQVDYAYCADGYLNSSWGRSVLLTLPGFFALALLGVSLWLFYTVFRNTGIIKN